MQAWNANSCSTDVALLLRQSLTILEKGVRVLFKFFEVMHRN